MKNTTQYLLAIMLLGLMICPASAKDKMPREDVIDVPAIDDGLSVHNLFQSNMVLQRGKPVSIWAGPIRGKR